MMTTTFSPPVHRGKPAALVLLVLALLLPLAGRTMAPAQPLPVQPELLALATERPDERVTVIVQKLAKDVPVEAVVSQIGGHVTKDLHIINAFAAEIPTRAVRMLAGSAGIRWVSLDAPVVETGGGGGSTGTSCTACLSTGNLTNAYIKAIGADKLWNAAPYLQGQGISVALVDSGVAKGHTDLRDPSNSNTNTNSRVKVNVTFNSTTNNASDWYGHGTHVAGIIGGNGTSSSGSYIGVAPKVNLVNVKVSDDKGLANVSDVVAGLQWVNDNRTTHNIRVVNLSLNSSIAQSYHVDPLAAAAEILWFNGIVVVASAGNSGGGNLYAPANDPFVITVGAMDDKNTFSTADDTLATFSAYGTTLEGIVKPDLVAPGRNIISTSSSSSSTLAAKYPTNIDKNRAYFRMSGTSMAAPMVTGAVALLLQDEPNLTPDQVKYRLMTTARPLGITGTGAGYLDAYAAVTGTTTANANTGLVMSNILTGGDGSIWNSASWGSASWGSASWGSASWGSASWGSTYWGN